VSDNRAADPGAAPGLEYEGPKTATNELLDAAEAIYAFLIAQDEGAGVEVGRRPN
jgi:hypothetical protein